MALNYLSQLFSTLSESIIKKDSAMQLPQVNLVKRKRSDSDFEEPQLPTKKQKIQELEHIEFPTTIPYETEVITYETESEYDARIKNEEIQKLKEKNTKLKKQLEDKDEIIKVLTQQLAAASKKTDAKFNIEVPLNFGVLNCN